MACDAPVMTATFLANAVMDLPLSRCATGAIKSMVLRLNEGMAALSRERWREAVWRGDGRLAIFDGPSCLVPASSKTESQPMPRGPLKSDRRAGPAT